LSTLNDKRNPIAKAIRLALIAGASLSAISSPAVFAADEEADDDKKVVITGSRITRADVENATPVTVIDREAMELTGLLDVGDLLQSIPSMSGSPIGTTTNNGGNGSVQIDLRGLGTARTLTLVNGRRVVDGGDYQAIPSTMIERVEILKDGASAVYGADAVAGVVNIITRRDFTGVEVMTQTAGWNNTDGAGLDSVSVIAGRDFDRGNMVFGIEHVKQEEAYQRDTPWGFMQDSYYIYPGGCENQVDAPWDFTPQGGCLPLGSSRIPESRLSFYSQGLFLIGTPATTPYEVGLMAGHDGRTYNYAPVNYMQTPYERTNVFGEANFEISDSVSFNAEFRGNKRTSSQELAPMPYTGGDPMHNGFYTDPTTGTTFAYEGISENNYYLRRAIDFYNATNGTSLIYEPVIGPRRRMIETTRRFEQDISQYQWTAGLEGEINDDTTWDFSINQGYRSRIDADFGQFSGQRLHNALGPSADLDNDGQPECYTDINDPNTLIAGCVPLNLFGGGAVDAAGNPTVTTLTQDMIDYVSLETVDAITQKQETITANITGVGAKLAGGDFGWSAGFSKWDQELTVRLDSAKTIGAVTGNVGANTHGKLSNTAYYAEFFAPVLDSLALKGGVRMDDWNAFGSETTYQFGVEFTPSDEVKLRATYGTVFRAPTISNLFGGLVDSFPTYTDPCAVDTGAPAGCAQNSSTLQTDSQVLARVGGNPNLQPELGDTFTAGIVWSPEVGEHSFNFIADYWSIELEDGIGRLGVQFILDQCYIEQIQDACALVTRKADYTIDNILDGALNISEETAKGVDLEFNWTYPASFGNMKTTVLWTKLLEREFKQFSALPFEDLVGKYEGAAYAEDKMNLSVQWTRDNWSVSYLGEYVSGLETWTWFSDYIQKIDAQYYSDIIVRYSADNNLTFTAGLTNITDEEPPFIDTGFNGKTDPSTYRMFGQGYYVRAKWTF